MEPLSSLLVEAQALMPAAVALRRDIHAHPEIGLDLPRTQAAVIEALDGLGLEVTTGSSLSSVVAVLDSGKPGPTVLLRGDMDALPMPEDTGFDFASTVPGVMHACGHDSHVAMLAGAATLLRSHERDLTGRVVLMFQPGEEGHHGARFMIEEGVLEVAGPVDVAFAIHQSPNYASGTMTTRGGTFMASADEFYLDVVGRGGHASAPYQALDPIPIACEIVLAIQSMVTRTLDIFDPAVVTVAHLNAGTTTNVIPERAAVHGTIRAISARTRDLVHHELRQLATGIASAHGATVDFQIVPGFPVTVNDPGVADWTRSVATGILGAQRVTEMSAPIMGAEDFSYVLERVPGAMVFLGTCPEDVELSSVAPCHSNRMRLDESAMATGIALYAGMALARSEAT
ncbi:MAG TPA: M20 family metallopeptidase [Acidimicrobiales bacterium]|nr:M20 family metallopeptidase [Acidimicrobiales bacterium]